MARSYWRGDRFVLELTRAEGVALFTLAGEGAEGLLTDATAGKAYIGDGKAVAAANRALRALDGIMQNIGHRGLT